MTMKMISSTSRMSMSGVTLMFGAAPAPPPALIPIGLNSSVGPPPGARSRSKAVASDSFARLRGGSRGRRGCARAFPLVGDQTDLVDAGVADQVNRLDDRAVIRLDVA